MTPLIFHNGEDAPESRAFLPPLTSALGDDFVAFHRLEYGGDFAPEEIVRAREEVRQAIENFFLMDELITRLRGAERLITQRALCFAHADTSVRAVPDVIVFNPNAAPTIIDWKVHVYGWRDAWLQLAIYAVALARCNPHKDFPPAAGRFGETDIGLLEVQLLNGTIRPHRLSEEQFRRADSYIAQSAESMLLATAEINGNAASLPATDFPATRYASICERCAYRSLC